MNHKIKTYSLIILSGLVGAAIYDLAINLKISYNQSTPKIMCKEGNAFEQIDLGSTVYIKTDKECINETMKGKQYDNTTRKNSTQN